PVRANVNVVRGLDPAGSIGLVASARAGKRPPPPGLGQSGRIYGVTGPRAGPRRADPRAPTSRARTPHQARPGHRAPPGRAGRPLPARVPAGVLGPPRPLSHSAHSSPNSTAFLKTAMPSVQPIIR